MRTDRIPIEKLFVLLSDKLSGREMNFRVIPYYCLLAIGLWLSGCSVFERSAESSFNMAYLYQPGQYYIHPRFVVYHEQEESSAVYFRIRTSEILFSQANVQVQFQSEIKIYYRLFELGNKRVLADSASVYHTIVKDQAGDEFIARFPVTASPGKKYMLEVIVTDLIRDLAVQSFVPVDKRNPFARQHFYVTDGQTGKPFFNTVVDSSTILHLLYHDPAVDTVYLSYFRDSYPASRPPGLFLSAESINYLPDTTYSVPLGNDQYVVFPRPGIYHFRPDTNRLEGLTFFHFGHGFPMVRYAHQMVEPLVYFAGPTDYNRMVVQPNRKLSVDNFWIQITGSMERAREMIRIFYTRVYFCNYYFSSYKEGWKTDRGMIYLIYGPPSILYKTDETEQWIYGREGSKDAVSFNFQRVESAFTDNHFVLLRSEALTTRWSLAVETWRSGRIFYIEDLK